MLVAKAVAEGLVVDGESECGVRDGEGVVDGGVEVGEDCVAVWWERGIGAAGGNSGMILSVSVWSAMVQPLRSMGVSVGL